MSDGREVESISTDTDEEWYEVSSDGEILETETQYAIRSVFHAMLEDGILVEPILSCDGLDFDVNQRDWQEHTLMHAVCRSVIGADVLPKAEAADMRLACDPSLIAAESTGPSLFESLRRRGGDVQARDCRGKNILHHLLDARSYPHPNAYPPLIHNTFKYILQHIPELVNSPDSHGTYPLHAALNRVRAIPFPGDRAELSPLESVVHDLLSAGARPLEVDSRGNTALHYLADCGLGERTDREPRRSLFRYFCRAGVDINARNHIGRTAIELFLDNHSVYERASDSRVPIEERQCDPAQSVHIENELFELLEATGARWTDVDAKGQTLLHWVARSKPWYARSRAIYLLEKGVDPRAKDRKGKTAKDVARAADNKAVVAVLVRWLASIASGQAAQA
jgi:ankyrin repeat protein